MGLTGTTNRATPGKPTRKAHPLAELNATLDQLDQEWAELEKRTPGQPHDALLVYYHATMRPALQWINADPYGFQFPQEYQRERLPRMCRWLAGLQHADRAQVKQAREQMLHNLKTVWPAYGALAYPDMPENWPGSVMDWEVPPFSFEALLGDAENWQQPDGQEYATKFLPAFRYQESADFHLSALALLFLNKQLRYYLSDLKPHPTDIDGRN